MKKKDILDNNYKIIFFISIFSVLATIVLNSVFTFKLPIKVKIANNLDWIGFWGSIVGSIISGFITLLGLRITINRERESDFERKSIEIMPHISIETCIKFSELNSSHREHVNSLYDYIYRHNYDKDSKQLLLKSDTDLNYLKNMISDYDDNYFENISKDYEIIVASDVSVENSYEGKILDSKHILRLLQVVRKVYIPLKIVNFGSSPATKVEIHFGEYTEYLHAKKTTLHPNEELNLLVCLNIPMNSYINKDDEIVNSNLKVKLNLIYTDLLENTHSKILVFNLQICGTVGEKFDSKVTHAYLNKVDSLPIKKSRSCILFE